MVSLVPFSNLLIFFPATVTCCGPNSSFFSCTWTWQQGKLFYPNAKGNFLGADSKVLFLCWHTLDCLTCLQWLMFSFMCYWSENRILTCFVCSPHWWVFDVVSDFLSSFFLLLRIFRKSATLRRRGRRIVLRITRLLYQSSNILCLVITTGHREQFLWFDCWECCGTVCRLYRNWNHRKLFCHQFA